MSADPADMTRAEFDSEVRAIVESLKAVPPEELGTPVSQEFVDDTILAETARATPSLEIGMALAAPQQPVVATAATVETPPQPFDVRWNPTGGGRKSGSSGGETADELGEFEVYLPYGSLTIHYGAALYHPNYAAAPYSSQTLGNAPMWPVPGALTRSYVQEAMGAATGDALDYPANQSREDSTHPHPVATDSAGNMLYPWRKVTVPTQDLIHDTSTSGVDRYYGTLYACCDPWGGGISIETNPVNRYDRIGRTSLRDDGYYGWSQAIAEVEIVEGSTTVERRVDQVFHGPVSLVWDTTRPFAVDYSYHYGSDYGITNCVMMLGRTQVWSENLRESFDEAFTGDVFIKITHSSTKFGLELIFEADSESSGEATTEETTTEETTTEETTTEESNDDQTVFKIYSFKEGYVVADYRDSIPVLPFFTSVADVPTSDDTEEPTSGDTEEPTSGDTEEPTGGGTEEPTGGGTEEPTSGAEENSGSSSEA